MHIIRAVNPRPRRTDSGATLVELAVVVAMIVIIMAIAVALIVRSKGSAEDGSAIGTLRAIAAAQVVARSSYGSFLRTTDLVDRGLLDTTFRPMPVTKHGYVISESGVGDSLAYTAVPQSLSSGARRFFMPVASGAIHFTDSGDTPTAAPPVIGSE